MIEKIISGGQTGVDQAALDVAIELNIPHGGWIPKGRKTEDGILPDKYQLKEMSTASYPKRSEQNILDSNGTLIISHGKLTGGSALTRRLAKKHKKPWLHIDLSKISAFIASGEIINWLYGYKIEVLNVAGPRASKDPAIYDATVSLLKGTLSSNFMEDEMLDPEETSHHWPQTVEEAVNFLITGLSFKDKAKIAKMEENQLSSLHITLGEYIRDQFGLWTGNKGLMESCRFVSKKYDIHYNLSEGDASALIIRELWRELRKTHTLRVVK